jgi:hypothetical protein
MASMKRPRTILPGSPTVTLPVSPMKRVRSSGGSSDDNHDSKAQVGDTKKEAKIDDDDDDIDIDSTHVFPYDKCKLRIYLNDKLMEYVNDGCCAGYVLICRHINELQTTFRRC